MPPSKSSAPTRQKRIQTANEAKQALASWRSANENYEGELQDWEFIYEDRPATGKIERDGAQATIRDGERPRRRAAMPAKGAPRRITGAKQGNYECHLGDCVMILNDSDRNAAWTGLISGFEIDEDNPDGESKRVLVKWFANPSEVKQSKRRNDELENEVYISSQGDSCPVGSIDGKARIMSVQAYNLVFPNGISKKSKDFGKTFVCRRGCDYQHGIYTPEFIWEDKYRNTEQSANGLLEWVDSCTKPQTKPKKRRFKKLLDDEDDGDTFVLGGGAVVENEIQTPRKKRKTSAASTPQKLRTPSKLFTPSHKRIIIKKPLEITPLGTRILSPSHVSGSPFQAARLRLHVSSVPDALPCREDEFATVYTHLESAINDGSGACIYISGTPGTGKTATVREVVAQLNAAAYADELETFKFVEINGMKVTDPHQSYALLWQALKGDRVSPSHALELLERDFSHPSPRRIPCVVLMDELDQLVTKNQSVMYNFFNWPSMRHSKLIVLAVANTMDLPERTLSNKISSRLGLTRITFPGYTHDQLMKIIQSRLEGVPGHIVESDAVQFASRKVAAVSGDARRALDICRRAVELAEAESLDNERGPTTPSKSYKGQKTSQHQAKSSGTVTIATVKRAINEATSSPLQQYLRALPLAAKVLLAALLMRTRRTGIAESTMGDVLDEAKQMAQVDTGGEVSEYLLRNEWRKKGIQFSTTSIKAPRLLAMGSSAIDLMEAGVIGLESRTADRTGKIRLNIGEEDVKLAFKDDPEIKCIGFSI